VKMTVDVITHFRYIQNNNDIAIVWLTELF
jgi:hypothetical protein